MGDSKAPSKVEREKCWGARDNYWNCINRYEDKLGTEKALEKCVELRKPYEEFCSKTWVKFILDFHKIFIKLDCV